MNVSELTDTELNRAMIWCYPPEHRSHAPFEDNGEFCWSGDYEDTIYYDYLDDYNLTMPLAVENGVYHGSTVCASGLSNAPIFYAFSGVDSNESDYCATLLRAYCETLVMIAMEGR